jgi:hypothetical protein
MTEALTRKFNAALVRADIRLNIRAYLQRINAEVFKEPIEDFVDDLLDLIISDEFCIPHTKLNQYGVITNEKHMCHNVGDMLARYEFKEGQDFSLSTAKSTGGRPAKMYYLKPRTFEHCLMRARNTDRYAKFYGLTKQCITLYDKYQIALKEQEIMLLANQNTELMRMMAEMRAESKQTGACVSEIKTDLREMKDQNGKILTGINEIKTQLDTVAAVADSEFSQEDRAADAAVEAAADIAIPPEKAADTDSLLLMRLGPRKYMASRIQVKAAARTIREQKKKYPNIREVLHLTDIPNGKYLWNNCKTALKDRIKMIGASPTIFTLEPGTTEQDVIAELNKLYDRPVKLAKLAGAATKARVAASRASVKVSAATGSRVMTRVTTTTVTETVDLTGDEIDAMLDEYLN